MEPTVAPQKSKKGLVITIVVIVAIVIVAWLLMSKPSTSSVEGVATTTGSIATTTAL